MSEMFSLQEMLLDHQECLRRQREAVKFRMRKISIKQIEITNKSLVMRETLKKTYEDIQKVLDEDLKVTLNQLEMEERAAVMALEELMERNCSLIREIEQDLARLTAELAQREILLQDMMDTSIESRVKEVLSTTDPSQVNLDELKADQILSLANKMLVVICSQIPITKRLNKSYSTDISLDPETAHPKLIISPRGDSATYTDAWQELPELPGRFDTTLNVISLQGFSSGRHYWEIDVSGKTYWELGLTYATIARKGRAEDCWLGRGSDSWAVEFFDGEYTAWHDGVPHQLPSSKRFSRIGVLCSFPAGLVSFLGADCMTPLFSFCTGAFRNCIHLALCPGHDHNGTNAKPIVICNANPPTCAFQNNSS
ncbi:E3 ubiquitin-protein ligase TRIM39-like [Esox lucius]|uniref:B30.2/SPRY domain-containing protein n=1 Tax=Esox lucius TaxID=8010 RepID=A0AAY5K451_ESOLU|nr:E3 ubiquitin-protein ligase TRIM39-like [Esox lucius]